MKLAVFGLLVSAGAQLPAVVYAQGEATERLSVSTASDQAAGHTLRTGNSAIDLLLLSPAESLSASAPARGAQKVIRPAQASSAAESTEQSLRDALLREAAVVVANQAATSEAPPAVVIGEEASNAGTGAQRSKVTDEERSDMPWFSAVRSMVATIREHRDWLVGGTLALAALVVAGAFARGRAARGSSAGNRRDGADRRAGGDRRSIVDQPGHRRSSDQAGGKGSMRRTGS